MRLYCVMIPTVCAVSLKYHHHSLLGSHIVSRGWAKASACRLQVSPGTVSLVCAALCQIVSLQYLSRSSHRRFVGLPCRLFLSYGLQLVSREVHQSSLRRSTCPAQDHFIFLALLIISTSILTRATHGLLS